MNNIRRDELEKIKRRRKRKSKFNGQFCSSRAYKAFNEHINASKLSINNNRLQNNCYNGNHMSNKSKKWTLGIFDNAICSRNMKDIFKPFPLEEPLQRDQICHRFVEQQSNNDENDDIEIRNVIGELAHLCNDQLKLSQPTLMNDNCKLMDKLRIIKSNAKRCNKLSLIDHIQLYNVAVVEDKCLANKKLVRATLTSSNEINNVVNDNPLLSNYSSLSMSSSILNARNFCRPMKINRYKSIPPIINNQDKIRHPLWDTPEILRTSHPSSFSDRSILDKTLLEMNETRFGDSLLVKE